MKLSDFLILFRNIRPYECVHAGWCVRRQHYLAHIAREANHDLAERSEIHMVFDEIYIILVSISVTLFPPKALSVGAEKLSDPHTIIALECCLCTTPGAPGGALGRMRNIGVSICQNTPAETQR